MKTSQTIIKAFKIAWLGFALAIIVQPVVAEDFTVIVPIELKNLPADVIEGSVCCTAWTAQNAWIGNNCPGPTFKCFNFDITGGNYSNTITVKFNAAPNRDPRLATKISVDLTLRKNGDVFQVPSQLLGTSGPYARIDMTQPFKESITVFIVNP